MPSTKKLARKGLLFVLKGNQGYSTKDKGKITVPFGLKYRNVGLWLNMTAILFGDMIRRRI